MEAIAKVALPDDWEERILPQFKYAFGFFSNRAGIVHCSYCGTEYEILKHDDTPSHGAPYKCHFCGTEGTWRATHYGRKNLTKRRHALISGRRGDAVIIRYYEVDVRFDRCGRDITRGAELLSTLSAVYYFSATERHYYRRNWWTNNKSISEATFTEKKTFRLPPDVQDAMHYHPPKRKGIYYYNTLDEMDRIMRGKPFQYISFTPAISLYFAWVYRVETITGDAYDFYLADTNAKAMISVFLRWCEYFLKYPAVELLMKSGFSPLVSAGVEDQSFHGAVNLHAHDLRRALGLTRNEIDEARECLIGLYGLAFYKKMRGRNDSIPMAVAEEYGDRGEFRSKGTCVMTKDMTRIQRTGIPLGVVLSYLYKTATKKRSPLLLSDYADYLSECEELGLDLTDKKVLVPKDLREAHERTGATVAELRAKEQAAAYLTGLRGFDDLVAPFASGSLMVRTAESAAEVVQEGNVLHHCVGSYLGRVARGECAIMLIREADRPDEPFYTLELSRDGRVSQVRGKYNCQTTVEVDAFVEEFKTTLKNRMKPRRRPKPTKKKKSAA
jgi:hypothetical protein